MRSYTLRAKAPVFAILVALMLFSLVGQTVQADDADLKILIREALNKNPEILAATSRIAASGHRISQVKSLPDPMISLGYQNDGFSRYSYGESSDSQWQYSASQTFPFPGKRSLKGNVASAETEVLKSSFDTLRLKTAARMRELYYDLFLVHKNLDIINEKSVLLARIEDAALARYTSGLASQQEVVMAQTEKYMLIEKEAMLRQKMQSLEAMINQTAGRDIRAPVNRPAAPAYVKYEKTVDMLIKRADDASPEIKARQKMVATAEARVDVAKKDIYPDFTLSAGYFQRAGGYQDMWSLSTSLSVPIYMASKQKPAINEALASLQEARYDMEATKLMVASVIRDNFSMVQATEKLADLYKNALLPKGSLDFDLAVSDYTKGKADVLTTVTRLKSLLDVELAYWSQLVEHEKAIGRLEAATGIMEIESS
jgi:outer membrane protein, heavy metal efflux system